MLLLPIDHLKKQTTIFSHQRREFLPDKKQIPGTAGGTVRCNAVTVARAISSDVYFFLQSKPIFNILVFNLKNLITHQQ